MYYKPKTKLLGKYMMSYTKVVIFWLKILLPLELVQTLRHNKFHGFMWAFGGTSLVTTGREYFVCKYLHKIQGMSKHPTRHGYLSKTKCC